jgi:hypothetical protein
MNEFATNNAEKSIETIIDAYNRLSKAEEAKPKIPKNIEVFCKGKHLYPITAEDYETLKPFFTGAYEQTFTMGNVTVKHNELITDAAHIVFGGNGYMAYDNPLKRLIELERIYRIIDSLQVMEIDINDVYYG